MVIYQVLIVISCAIIGYLFGSIPTGVIISKIFYHKDPRNYGSHNTGGTNVGRTVSKKAGLITIILDMFKLIIPFFTIFLLFTYNQNIFEFMSGDDNAYNTFGQGNTLVELSYYICALATMIGHSNSIFLRFKGGKIVSTFSGLTISSFWFSIPIFGGLFFLVLKKTKIVSIASILTSASVMLFSWIVYIIFIFCGPKISGYFMFSEFGPHMCIYNPIVFTLSFILLVFKHRSNILRIKNHSENTIKWMK